MQDNNTPEYLDHVEATFAAIASRLNPEGHPNITE
jgi:hypothetical protein